MAIVALPAKEKYLVGETSENLVLSRNRYLERESRITYLELGKKKTRRGKRGEATEADLSAYLNNLSMD